MSIWEKFPDLSESELRSLAAAAAQVLLESDDAYAEVSEDLLEISPKAAARQIAGLLDDPSSPSTVEKVQSTLEDEHLSREVSLAVLGEIRNHPALAAEVEERFALNARKMGTPELLLLTGALVILSIKIKEIRWSRKEKVVKFFESGEAIKSFLSGLLGMRQG